MSNMRMRAYWRKHSSLGDRALHRLIVRILLTLHYTIHSKIFSDFTLLLTCSTIFFQCKFNLGTVEKGHLHWSMPPILMLV